MPLISTNFVEANIDDVLLLEDIPYVVVSKKKKLIKIEELADDPKSRWLSIANFNRKKFNKLVTE